MPLLPGIITTIRIILGLWIFLAGFLKFLDIHSFTSIMRETKLFNKMWSDLIGYIYPFLEMLIGLSLLLKTGVVVAVPLLFAKQMSSLIFLLMLLGQKRHLENCGCYGTFIPLPLKWTRLIDNGIILVLTLVLILS